MVECKREPGTENTFQNFSKNLLKSFILLITVTLLVALKNKLITKDTTMFYIALFVIGGTLLFSILNLVDSYVYSNLVLGVGIALGMQIMDWRV
jgi:uncharacterized protein YebE (UPF0316 family)